MAWGKNEDDENCVKLKENLENNIVLAIKSGYQIFLCGMAEGFDTMCAEAVIKLKKAYPYIKLVCVFPYKRNIDKNLRLNNIVNNSNQIIFLNEKYYHGCMFERNRYMVNNSSRVIAYFNGTSGGTKYTVDFAKNNNLEVVNLY